MIIGYDVWSEIEYQTSRFIMPTLRIILEKNPNQKWLVIFGGGKSLPSDFIRIVNQILNFTIKILIYIYKY